MMEIEQRVDNCISNTRNAMVKLGACNEQLIAFDEVMVEWRPFIIKYLNSGGRSIADDFLNLVYRYTSIGAEFYLRENVSGQSKALNDNVNW